jgi:CBS domain-containing membrane protein
VSKSFYLSDVKAVLGRFLPLPNTLGLKERFVVASGALLSLLFATLSSYLIGGRFGSIPLLVAPMGATSILIFALPSSPLAQPWSVCFGNFISASIGVACAALLGHHPVVASLAVWLSILAMFATRSLHPPGGAVALLAVLGGTQIERLEWYFVLESVVLQSTCLVVIAAGFHHLRKVNYPQSARLSENLHRTGDPQISARLGVTSADLDVILAKHGKLLDISRTDLQTLITNTEIQVQRRRHGVIRCSEIMSRHVVTVKFETRLEECWQLLRTHKVKTLPVIDDQRKVIGTISLIDFLKNAGLDVYHDFDLRLRQLLENAHRLTGSRYEVAGHIMNTSVQAKVDDSDILELVALFTDLGLHSVPILNSSGELQGVITQTDLIATLYRMQIDKPLDT